jgi:hypothetical protein
MSRRAAAQVARWRRRAIAAGAVLAAVLPAVGATTTVGAGQLVPRTSCRRVVHIGDSLSAGMDSTAIAEPAHRIDARYRDIGVQDVRLEISGGRSVVEHLEGQDGGEAVARRLRREGFSGCWVVDLATNDAANVSAGSGYGYSERIDRMMAVIGSDPVMWVDTTTRRARGHYASEHMRLFNQALEKAHARYPTLVVYEWSEAVHEDWFQGDGIHFTAAGSAYRAALIAGALAEAFPAGSSVRLRSGFD